jgi:large subunit ribosomal protein L6
MSRIGRLPIEIPKGVTCTFSEARSLVTVKGPKGELKQKIDTDFKIVLEEGN